MTEITTPISQDLANNSDSTAFTVSTHASGGPSPAVPPAWFFTYTAPPPLGFTPYPVPPTWLPLPAQGAVCGVCDTGIGVRGESSGGPAVYGHSSSGAGVYGVSSAPSANSAAGVFGFSQNYDAVVGVTQSAFAGVTGRNLTEAGYGIYAVGGQYAAKIDGAMLITGAAEITSNLTATGTVSATYITASNQDGRAIYGVSQTQDAIAGTSAAPTHAGVSAVNTGGGFGLWAQGATAGYFGGNVQVTGNMQVTGNSQVTGNVSVGGDITFSSGSGDCAEEFDLTVTGQTIEPGTVMVIADGGELAIAREPYDRRVAGVVSGAGLLKPAIILDKRESQRSRAAVALVGKVYCKADADYAPIEVGDMLTSSLTPGHAMRASDQAMAFGSVLGKALSRLTDGKGLIPILIALQ